MSVAAAFIICRFVHFSAVMLVFGISAFVTLAAPPALQAPLGARTRGALGAGVALTILSALAMVAIQAAQMGNGWSDASQASVWQAVMGTAFGRVWQWHLGFVAAAGLTWCLPSRSRWRYPAVGAAAALTLASLGLVGHAAMQEGLTGLFHRANQIVHLLSAGVWLGGLLPLLRAMPFLSVRESRADAICALRRFSSAGHVAVALVLVTGSLNTALVLHTWPIHWTSPYQVLLACKIALVGIMTVVAVLNRYVWVPRMRLSRGALQAFVFGTRLELALGCGVLALVSIFATFEPV